MSDEKKQQELQGLQGALDGCKTSIRIVSASPVGPDDADKAQAYQWLKHVEYLLIKSISEVEKAMSPEPPKAA